VLFNSASTAEPLNPVLYILFHSRLQLGLVQMEIIHRANSQDAHPRIPRADTIHQRPTSGTEVIGHGVSRGDRLGLGKRCHVLFSSDVFDVLIVDDELNIRQNLDRYNQKLESMKRPKGMDRDKAFLNVYPVVPA